MIEWAHTVRRASRVLTLARRPTRGDRRGFTLVEVMLAVAILATIVVLTWGTVSSSFRFRRASLDKFDRYRNVQQALDRMNREISMAFVTNVGQVATSDDGEIQYQTAFIGRDDELTFTSLAHVRTRADEIASEQCEISYRLERQRGRDGEMQQNLVRREDAPIDNDPEEGGVLYTLMEDVEDITFEYWDGTREIGSDAWTRQWNALDDYEGVLPERVRITIEVKHPLNDRRTIEFVTQTRVAMTEPLIILPPDLVEEINEAVAEDCLNGRDDDLDGNTDCNDDECIDSPLCEDFLADQDFVIGGNSELGEADE